MLRSLGLSQTARGFTRGFSTRTAALAPKLTKPQPKAQAQPNVSLPSNYEFFGNTQVKEKVEETLEQNVIKKFSAGELYDPFDFSIAKIRLDKKRATENYKGRKFFDDKRVNPLDCYTDTKYLSSYLTSTGRILSREVTKLSLKNQKRLAKALKRARAAGLISTVHRDTQLLNFTNDYSHRH